jgi:hypothetical protein
MARAAPRVVAEEVHQVRVAVGTRAHTHTQALALTETLD